MINYDNFLPMSQWAEDDQPREKLLNKGKRALSNAELVCILLAFGTKGVSALEVAKNILMMFDNDLNRLSRASVEELRKIKGVGKVKAVKIAAALELGQRRVQTDIKKRPQIRTSEDAHKIISNTIKDLHYEEFWIILLNRANEVIGKKEISKGGVSGTVVDAKLVFNAALKVLASSIILCHNHPSGNLKPSQADIDLTRKIKAAGKTLDISVLDHLIVSEKGFYSFADEGIM